VRPELSWLSERIAEWDRLGKETFADGTVLTGKVPHLGSHAYLHQQFAPLRIEAATASERLGFRPPVDLIELWNWSNGLFLFHLSLSMYGLAGFSSRDLDAPPRAFSAETPNVRERPQGLPDEYCVVGGYGYDGTKILMAHDGTISVCARCDGRQTRKVSASVFEFLAEEYARLRVLFDSSGRETGDERLTALQVAQV
jgi:hypothetical protein